LALMDRFPVVITAGGALLGWIGGGMLVTDPALPAAWRDAVPYGAYLASGLGALLVVAVGKWLASRKRAAAASIDLTPARTTPTQGGSAQ